MNTIFESTMPADPPVREESFPLLEQGLLPMPQEVERTAAAVLAEFLAEETTMAATPAFLP